MPVWQTDQVTGRHSWAAPPPRPIHTWLHVVAPLPGRLVPTSGTSCTDSPPAAPDDVTTMRQPSGTSNTCKGVAMTTAAGSSTSQHRLTWHQMLSSTLPNKSQVGRDATSRQHLTR